MRRAAILSSWPQCVNLLRPLMSVRRHKASRHVFTHWVRVTHICVSDPTSIGSDNDLSPGRRQAIIWTNAGIFLIGPLGTSFSEIVIKMQTFSLRKMRLKMSYAKRQPFCRLGLNVFYVTQTTHACQKTQSVRASAETKFSLLCKHTFW